MKQRHKWSGDLCGLEVRTVEVSIRAAEIRAICGGREAVRELERLRGEAVMTDRLARLGPLPAWDEAPPIGEHNGPWVWTPEFSLRERRRGHGGQKAWTYHTRPTCRRLHVHGARVSRARRDEVKALKAEPCKVCARGEPTPTNASPSPRPTSRMRRSRRMGMTGPPCTGSCTKR